MTHTKAKMEPDEPRGVKLLSLLVAGCFLVAALGLILTRRYELSVPALPAMGIALGGMVLTGLRTWPWFLIATALASFLVALGHHQPLDSAALLPSLLPAIGSSVGALLGAWLVRRAAKEHAGYPAILCSVPSLLLAVCSAALVGASLGTASLPGVSSMVSATIFLHWIASWLSFVISGVVFLPLVLAWGTSAAGTAQNARIGEWLLLVTLTVAGCGVIFWGLLFDTRITPLAFLTVPFLLWASYRFGGRTVSLITAVIAVMSLTGTLEGRGPFAMSSVELSLLAVQNFVPVAAVLGLVLPLLTSPVPALEASQKDQYYRALFDLAPLPGWIFDRQTFQFLAVNKAAIEHYGYTESEFLSMTIEDLRPNEDIPALRVAIHSKAHGKIGSVWRHKKKDGSILEAEVFRQELTFKGRQALVVLCRDITDINRAQRRNTAFAEIGRRLSSTRTAHEAALILAETAESLVGWDTCTLRIRGAGAADPTTVFRGTKRNDGAVQVTETEEPQNSEFEQAINNDPDNNEGSFDPSVMRAPLRLKGNVIALFDVRTTKQPAYTRENLGTLEALADHCAGTLERIRAEHNLEQRLAEQNKAEQEVLRLNAELETRVQDRTAQLEATNKELESFAYSVSHDLRAPLRSIRGFGEVLVEKYAANLDARGREFLTRICTSSQQMDRLIEDLLELSRVSRTELNLLPVNLTKVAREIVADLRKNDPERHIIVDICEGLETLGDERLLRIVMDNLIRNAWKFTGRSAEASVVIGRTDAPENAFYVRDNGAGFSMNQVSRLFGVFQRLHSAADFPGTGVGLATVQRIINRHGGRVWASGEPGKGATFYFVLPKMEKP